MRFSRKHLLIVVVAVLATISLLAFPFSASAAQISVPGYSDAFINTTVGNKVTGSAPGSIKGVVAYLENTFSPISRTFYANSRGEFSIYPWPDDESFGTNLDYSVDLNFSYDLNLFGGAGLKNFSYFNVNVYFYVRQEYNFNANSNIQNAYFFQPYGYGASIDGHPVDMFLNDYYVHHANTDDPYYANGYYVEAHYSVDVSTIDSSFFTRSELSNFTAPFEFWLTSLEYLNAYPDQHLMVISTLTSSVDYSYTYLPFDSVPLDPEVISRIEALGMAGSLVGSSATGVDVISNLLLTKTPKVHLNLSGIGDVDSVDTGASFFSDLFSFLITNTICQSFVSVGILFAFVTFILRR